MKTIHLVIIMTLGIIATCMIVFILNSDLNTPPSHLTLQNNKTENIVQPISEAALCVTHIENQTIDAGHLGDFSCPAPEFYTQTKILKINGFYGVYHNSTNERTDTYVLEPGHAGSITYVISGHAIKYEGPKPPAIVIKNQTEISNDVIYIHHKVVTVPQTVKTTYQIVSNGSKVPYYWACYKTPIDEQYGGEECYGGPGPAPSDHITMDTMLYTHPGIDVTYQPKSEIISNNQTATVTATISSASDAPTGTYWIILSPGQCNGGQILLLTVVNCSDVRK